MPVEASPTIHVLPVCIVTNKGQGNSLESCLKIAIVSQANLKVHMHVQCTPDTTVMQLRSLAGHFTQLYTCMYTQNCVGSMQGMDIWVIRLASE